jgi:hypothetical protein
LYQYKACCIDTKTCFWELRTGTRTCQIFLFQSLFCMNWCIAFQFIGACVCYSLKNYLDVNSINLPINSICKEKMNFSREIQREYKFIVYHWVKHQSIHHSSSSFFITLTIVNLAIYPVFIFTWFFIPVPNEQKSSTWMHFFDKQGFGAIFFFYFLFLETVKMWRRKIKFCLYRSSVRFLESERISENALSMKRMYIFQNWNLDVEAFQTVIKLTRSLCRKRNWLTPYTRAVISQGF